MSVVSSTSSAEVTLTSGNTNTVVNNVVIVDANTEQSFALPSNCKSFLIRVRELVDLKLSYAIGESGTEFLTLRAGTVYSDLNFYSNQSLFFQCATAGVTIEIVTYAN